MLNQKIKNKSSRIIHNPKKIIYLKRVKPSGQVKTPRSQECEFETWNVNRQSENENRTADVLRRRWLGPRPQFGSRLRHVMRDGYIIFHNKVYSTLRDDVRSRRRIIQWPSSNDRPAIMENDYVLPRTENTDSRRSTNILQCEVQVISPPRPLPLPYPFILCPCGVGEFEQRNISDATRTAQTTTHALKQLICARDQKQL